jgi:hypothetical protein
MTGSTVAVGRRRMLPTPDPIASDYLVLALRLDQRIPGLVDAYFGPADLKAQVDMEQFRRPARLVADAAALRNRVRQEVSDPQRARWLDRQLLALETHAGALNGEVLPYEEHLVRAFDYRLVRRPDERFRAAAVELDRLVPGTGPLAERLAAWDAALTVPVDRLPDLAAWLVERFRARAMALFGVPEGESLRVELVRGQPWSGYNWYDGALASRVDINVDLPVRAPDLIHVISHETFPGHHLEHAWKEADLVDRQGRLEATVLLINTPEALISEGLANLGYRFAVEPDAEASLLADVLERAGIRPVDASNVVEWAGRQVTVARLRRGMGEIDVNAALMRHADGLSHDDVLGYLIDVGLMRPERAEKRLSFIEHPLWRTYVFVYSEGEQLLARWLDQVEPVAQAARFNRLLHEQLTPSAVLAEVAG